MQRGELTAEPEGCSFKRQLMVPLSKDENEALKRMLGPTWAERLPSPSAGGPGTLQSCTSLRPQSTLERQSWNSCFVTNTP